jgi:hypothetical protein
VLQPSEGRAENCSLHTTHLQQNVRGKRQISDTTGFTQKRERTAAQAADSCRPDHVQTREVGTAVASRKSSKTRKPSKATKKKNSREAKARPTSTKRSNKKQDDSRLALKLPRGIIYPQRELAGASRSVRESTEGATTGASGGTGCEGSGGDAWDVGVEALDASGGDALAEDGGDALGEDGSDALDTDGGDDNRSDSEDGIEDGSDSCDSGADAGGWDSDPDVDDVIEDEENMSEDDEPTEGAEMEI